jgi:NAD(P)-dependent dehydrogenase (short-subunit alcohol dehydrogenase family)
MPNWTVNDIPPQTEKLAVVTGATGGLGFETALGLAQAGAEVVLAGRNREKGRSALERIMRALPVEHINRLIKGIAIALPQKADQLRAAAWFSKLAQSNHWRLSHVVKTAPAGGCH